MGRLLLNTLLHNLLLRLQDRLKLELALKRKGLCFFVEVVLRLQFVLQCFDEGLEVPQVVIGEAVADIVVKVLKFDDLRVYGFFFRVPVQLPVEVWLFHLGMFR